MKYIFLSLIFLMGCSHYLNKQTAFQTKKNRWLEDQMFANDDEFIPLEESDLQIQFADHAIPQPKEIPGAIGSGIPSLDQFRRALGNLAQIFQNVYFNTDEHVVRRPEHLLVLDKIAEYLKKHPNTYISVGGHCDERGSEAYNLALGTRRSNYVRSLLVQRGVSPNHIHSISFGKEQPVDKGHTASSWTKNRRVEFKIFEK